MLLRKRRSESIAHDQGEKREQQRQFQMLAESISNLVWIANPDGWIFWYNRRWYEYTGTTPGQMDGWGWQSVHDPRVLPEVLRRWKASIASGEPFDMVFPLRGADGAFRPFLTRVMPLKDGQGRVLRWFGTNTDISREMGWAEALRKSEQRFRAATEALSSILWTNNAIGEMEGEQPGWAEFTGQTWDEYHGYGWSAAVHPQDAQPTIDAWQAAVREQRRFAFEHRVRRADGMYRLCSIHAVPALREDGSIREWVGVHTDITDERATQDKLRQTVDELRQQQEIMEAAQLMRQVGFWRYVPAERTVFLSAGSRHLFGLPPEGDCTIEEAVGHIHPEDRALVDQAMQEALVITKRYQAEFRTLGPAQADGGPEEVRWVMGVARVVEPEGGAPYFVGMNLDITHHRRSAEALARTEKLAVVGRLATSIAHEINNPLEAVMNLLYLLRCTDLTEEQAEYAKSMQSELERVSHIATHTLRFHRQSTRATETDLGTVLDSVLALHEGRLRNADVEAARRYRGNAAITGFDGELRQVFANVVGNAIDAMSGVERPRKLSLRVRPALNWATGAQGVRATIADTGSGIARQALERIFDPFYTTKPATGTGLGLWISREIVGKHHGAIRVKSRETGPRRGTIFQVFLPLTGRAEEAAANTNEVEAAPQ